MVVKIMKQPVDVQVNKKRSPIIWIYLIFGALILIVLVRSTQKMLEEAPNRKASVDLPGVGLVTVQFSTSPNPPLPTGTVILNFMPTDNRNRMMNLGGSLPISNGMPGSDKPVGSGQAVLDTAGMTYQAGVQFPMA
jgi:hypothetical protein